MAEVVWEPTEEVAILLMRSTEWIVIKSKTDYDTVGVDVHTNMEYLLGPLFSESVILGRTFVTHRRAVHACLAVS